MQSACLQPIAGESHERSGFDHVILSEQQIIALLTGADDDVCLRFCVAVHALPIKRHSPYSIIPLPAFMRRHWTISTVADYGKNPPRIVGSHSRKFRPAATWTFIFRPNAVLRILVAVLFNYPSLSYFTRIPSLKWLCDRYARSARSH